MLLKPCPNCGSNKVYEAQQGNTHSRRGEPLSYWIQCEDCNFRSMEADTKSEALEIWNRIKRPEDIELSNAIKKFARQYIKDCPFCGHFARLITSDDGKLFHVACNYCDCQTRECIDMIEAITLWNRRI